MYLVVIFCCCIIYIHLTLKNYNETVLLQQHCRYIFKCSRIMNAFWCCFRFFVVAVRGEFLLKYVLQLCRCCSLLIVLSVHVLECVWIIYCLQLNMFWEHNKQIIMTFTSLFLSDVLHETCITYYCILIIAIRFLVLLEFFCC